MQTTDRKLTMLLIRHGETDFNRDGIIQGQTDIPLNGTGAREAAGLAALLKDRPIDKIYASPLARAMKTAGCIAGPRGLVIEPVPALKEFDFGRWDGLRFGEIKERHALEWASWMENWRTAEAPGGESFEAFFTRVVDAVEGIRKADGAGTVAIVTHSGCIRTILAHYITGNCAEGQWRFQVETGSLAEIYFGRFGPSLLQFNRK